MRYDSQTDTTTLDIIARALAIRDVNSYILTLILPELIGAIGYLLDDSYIRVIIKDLSGNVIVDRLGGLLNPIYNGGMIENTAIEPSLYVPTIEPYTVDISGRIYLTNNTFCTFNKENILDVDSITLHNLN